jgi:hypothetical protein
VRRWQVDVYSEWRWSVQRNVSVCRRNERIQATAVAVWILAEYATVASVKVGIAAGSGGDWRRALCREFDDFRNDVCTLDSKGMNIHTRPNYSVQSRFPFWKPVSILSKMQKRLNDHNSVAKNMHKHKLRIELAPSRQLIPTKQRAFAASWQVF